MGEKIDDTSFIQSIYKMLVMMSGVSPRDIRANYRHEDGEGRVLIALPDTKVAISTEGDTVKPFMEDDWTVITIPVQHMKIFGSVMKNLEVFDFEHKRRGTMKTVKQTSRHEQWLIDGCIMRGIEVPERNHRINRDNGKELTTPDLAWPEIKLAFFVDGTYWHVTRHDKEMISDLIESEGNQNALLNSNKSRVEKDLTIRSEMQADGWTVLACTDSVLEKGDGVHKQVDLIERTIKNLRETRQALARANGVDLSGLDDLI